MIQFEDEVVFKEIVKNLLVIVYLLVNFLVSVLEKKIDQIIDIN